MLLLLLIVPGTILALWLACVIAIADLAAPLVNVRNFKNVLAIFAHADDETINCGGAISRFTRAEATVTIILLTAGERGNPHGLADTSLKAIRRSEAESAVRLLGVSRLIQQDFGDGQLSERRHEVKAFLVEAIQEIAPDLVLTHDPSGIYGHPDHVACADLLIELKRTRYTNLTLWCVTLPRRVVTAMKLVGQLRIDPSVEGRRLSPTVRIFIGTSVIPKIRAWYAYRSQRVSIRKGFGRLVPLWLAASIFQFEYFAEVL